MIVMDCSRLDARVENEKHRERRRTWCTDSVRAFGTGILVIEAPKG
jgi:hypothetical protein